MFGSLMIDHTPHLTPHKKHPLKPLKLLYCKASKVFPSVRFKVLQQPFNTIRERVLLRIVFYIQWIYMPYPVYLCDIAYLFPLFAGAFAGADDASEGEEKQYSFIHFFFSLLFSCKMAGFSGYIFKTHPPM